MTNLLPLYWRRVRRVENIANLSNILPGSWIAHKSINVNGKSKGLTKPLAVVAFDGECGWTYYHKVSGTWDWSIKSKVMLDCMDAAERDEPVLTE